MLHFYKYFVCLLHSLLFLAVRGQCPAAVLLNMSARRVCGRPVLVLPSLTSHTDVASAYLRRSILATWPPHFRLRMGHCHDVCDGSLPVSAPVTLSLYKARSILRPIPFVLFSACFSTRHPVAIYNMQYPPSHLPLTIAGHQLFLLLQSLCLGTSQQDRQYTGFQDAFLCLQFFF
jgi:hypothetical protein